jgi:hypothetical protein
MSIEKEAKKLLFYKPFFINDRGNESFVPPQVGSANVTFQLSLFPKNLRKSKD